MRAVVVEQAGGPEELAVRDVPVPDPGPGEVALDVAWAGVNFAEVKQRATGYRIERWPFTPGLEAAGTVRALGAGVTGLRVGQRVAAATLSGGYAEVAVAAANLVFPVPDGLPLRTAATLPIVLPTAVGLLRAGRLAAGGTVLVQSAAGGVGTVLGQLARRAGAGRILGTVSRPEKEPHLKQYGYDAALVGDGWAAQARELTGGAGVDLLLDPVGGPAWEAGLGVLAPWGRAVSFGNASGAPPWSASQAALAPRSLSVSGFSVFELANHAPDALRELAVEALGIAERGEVELPITAEHPLDAVADAHRALESRTTVGKLVLRIGG